MPTSSKNFFKFKDETTSCEFLLEKCLVKLFRKWSRQMTKFTSDKQGHQTKQKQERKQRLKLLS
jgi:hypothetical protein